MKLAQLRAGDVVEVDVKGRRFYALVSAKPAAGRVSLDPINRNEGWHEVSARQVVTHFRRQGAPAGASAPRKAAA